MKRHAGTFDRVLVDAPCTGTGTWRRNPDAKWKLAPEDLEELSQVQRNILDSAWRLVKPGGRLIYATCSLLAEENEAQIDAFLAAHADFKPVPVATYGVRSLAHRPLHCHPGQRAGTMRSFEALDHPMVRIRLGGRDDI